jgi:hypothetical protein
MAAAAAGAPAPSGRGPRAPSGGRQGSGRVPQTRNSFRRCPRDAVAPLVGAAEGGDEIAPLVWVVDLDGIAHPRQAVGHPARETHVARLAVAVAEHEVRTPRTRVEVHRVALRFHGMAVAMPDRPVPGNGRLDRFGQPRPVGPIAIREPALDFSERELAPVKRDARKGQPADEPHPAPGVIALLQGAGPGRFEQLGIEVARGPVRIDIGPGKQGGDQGGPGAGGGLPQLVDETVAGSQDRGAGGDGLEVRRIDHATVRRIVDDRQGLRVRPVRIKDTGYRLGRHSAGRSGKKGTPDNRKYNNLYCRIEPKLKSS